MNGKDRLEEMLSDKGDTDPEIIEKISKNCSVLTDEQKNRILGIIREKESGTYDGAASDESGNGEEEMKIVEYRKSKGNIIRIAAGLAACICIVSGIRLLGSKNEQFIPSEDPGKTTTAVSETSVSDTSARSENKLSVTEKTAVVRENAVTTVTEKSLFTEEISVKADSAAAESTAENTGSGDVQKNRTTGSTDAAETAAAAETAEVLTTEVGQSGTKGYFKLYEEQLDQYRVDKDSDMFLNTKFSYILFDMDKDGVPELIVEHRTETDPCTVSFFNIRNNKVENSGFSVSRKGTITFYEDQNTGRLCIESMYNGTGTIASYGFDGDSFYEADAISDYEYGNDHDSFIRAAEEMFSLSRLLFGRVDWSGSSVWVGYDEMKFIEGSKYYFNE